MAAAVQQRPEVVTKISGQICGMGQRQTVEILNVQAKLTAPEILQLIHRLDPATIFVDELVHDTTKDPPLTNVNGKGLSSYTTMRIADLPVSDKMLSTLQQGGLAGMEEWYFRPHQPRLSHSDLPGVAIKATDGSRTLLALLKAAGLSKVQIEQLVLSMLNKRLEGTVAAGTVTDVFFFDTKDRMVVDDKNQMRNSRSAADFAEVGRGLVTLKEKEHEGIVVQHLDSQLDFTLGEALDVPALDQIRAVFPVTRRFSGKLRAELAQTAQLTAEEKAKKSLIPGGGAMVRVQVQVNYDFRDGKRTEALKKTPVRKAEREIKALLGDAPRGILAVAMTVCPDSLTVQWRDELSIYVQGPDLAQTLITRLRTGIRRAERGADPTDVIKSMRMVNTALPTVMTITQKQAARPDSAARTLASVAELEEAIAIGVFESDRTVMFPIQTRENTAIIWTSQPGTETEDALQQTTLEQLQDVCFMDGFTDLRQVLDDKALEYNAAVLLKALMNLIGSKSLLAETSDDETHLLLFSARKYQSQAKRRRAADNQDDAAMRDVEPGDGEEQHSEAKKGFGGSFHPAGRGGGRGSGSSGRRGPA
jgi:hypothetical protein